MVAFANHFLASSQSRAPHLPSSNRLPRPTIALFRLLVGRSPRLGVEFLRRPDGLQPARPGASARGRPRVGRSFGYGRLLVVYVLDDRQEYQRQGNHPRVREIGADIRADQRVDVLRLASELEREAPKLIGDDPEKPPPGQKR